MTSFKQIEANRRNARKSTGPTTEEGKQRSRSNAVRHRLTAETEAAEHYKAFEAAIIADCDAQTAVERELVSRLASLLWRLRRATTMETALFEIQADHLSGFRQARQVHQPPPRGCLRAVPADRVGQFRPRSRSGQHHERTESFAGSVPKSVELAADPATELARCFFASRQSAQLHARPPQPQIQSRSQSVSRP